MLEQKQLHTDSRCMTDVMQGTDMLVCLFKEKSDVFNSSYEQHDNITLIQHLIQLVMHPPASRSW